MLLPTETLSVFCFSSTIITPPSAMLLCPFLIRPGTAFPAVSDLALPHNPQELILPGLNRPYSTDQNYKKPVHSPPQSKGKAWREEMLPVVFYNDSFHTFQSLSPSSIDTCRVKTLSSGVGVVTLISDTAYTKSFLWKELPPVQSFLIQSSFSFRQNLPELTTSNSVFFLHHLLYFISFYFVCCPSLPFQRCLPGEIHVPCTFYSVHIIEHYLHNLSFTTCCLPSG